MATNGTGRRGAVVVTGASTGIGQACALRLDKIGFHVFAGVRREEDGARVKSQASERLSPLIIDVADAASIALAKDTVTAALGDSGLAGLVNNAGIGVGGALEYMPIDDLRRQLEVNVIGQIAVTQAFLPLIRKGKGRIVNMGSIGGKVATPFLGPYNASKFAMEALTDALRQELRPWGIQVAIVEPGNIKTPIWEKAKSSADEVERTMPEEGRQLYSGAIAALRNTVEKQATSGIPPDEVAKRVEHALTASSPKTRYLVGGDARAQAVLGRVVPDRVRDGLVARYMGLPSKP
jgi:NAD(P)-dependent dehydrogenase (short-subunit alcohol dehydrogenase family)